jgi:hypothetical protein
LRTETGFRQWRVGRIVALLLALVSVAALGIGGVAAGAGVAAATHTLQGVVTAGGSGAVGSVVVALQPGQSPASTPPAGPSGSYSLPLGDGDWSVAVAPPPPTLISPTWVYTGGVQLASFAPADGAKSLDFVAMPARATITGNLIAPGGGTAFGSGNRAWVRAANQEGQGNAVQVNPVTGAFSVNVLPGNTMLHLVLENQDWAPPTTLAGSVYYAADGQSQSTGPLQLVQKQATITGAVLDEHGQGVANLPVRAWRLDGSEFQEVTSGVGRSYTMHVISGTWELRAVPPADSGYVTAQPPQRIVLASDTASATQTLRVVTADVTIDGTLIDSTTGQPPSPPIDGHAFALYRAGADDRRWPQLGPAVKITNNTFTLKLASAVSMDYRIGAFFPQGAQYTALTAKPITITPGQTVANFTLPVAPNNSTISGHFNSHDTGQPQLGLPGIVYAASNRLGVARDRLNPLDGSYALNVATTDETGHGGSFWWLHAFVDPTTGYIVQRPRNQRVFLPYANGQGSTATADFTVAKIDAVIAGRVTDAQGQPVAGARVSIHEQAAPSDAGFDRWDLAGADGRYRIRVTAGTYKVRADFRNLIQPVPQIVTVASGDTAKNTDLQFRAKDATIAGQVIYNGAGHPAFVRAFSSTGAHLDTLAGADGRYALRVNAGDSWNIQAVSEAISTTGALSETIFLKSAAQAITPHVSPPPNALNLTLLPSDTLPDAVAFGFDAAEDQALTLADGTQLRIPAGALAPSGQVTVAARPRVDLADDGGAQPVSFGYRVEAFDASHLPITHFNTPVTIVLPFTAAQLSALGVTADQLVPSYWDEATASWKPVPNVVVSQDAATGDGTVNIQVDHFTDFALLGANGGTVFLPLIVR